MARLRKEVAKLKIERDILKKADLPPSAIPIESRKPEVEG